jgi:F-type H+-transporting ATPase subunit gamma
MTERLADINARISGVRQLGAIVNAMRGIAAARAQQARSQLAAVDAYAGTIGQAIGRALALRPVERVGGGRTAVKRALILFCAEQGFAGAFSEHALNFAGDEIATSELYLIGSRGAAIAAEKGIAPTWKNRMPSHSSGVPKLADRIAEALFAGIVSGKIDRVDIIFNQWRQAQRTHVERRPLFPLDWAMFNAAEQANPPLTYLKPETLLAELTFAYMHAQLCNAALHAFAAENEARMEAMAGAHGEIERNLNSLLSMQRILRQEEITAEILELAAGVAATAGFASRNR